MAELIKVKDKRGVVRYITRKMLDLQPKGKFEIVEGELEGERKKEKLKAQSELKSKKAAAKKDAESADDDAPQDDAPQSDLDYELREAYKAATGKKAPKNWKTETIKQKLEDEAS